MLIGVEYLSSGNRGDDPDSQLDADFAFFKQPNVNLGYVQVRLVWGGFYAGTCSITTGDSQNSRSQCEAAGGVWTSETTINPDVVANYVRLVRAAERAGVKLGITFWTQAPHDDPSGNKFYPSWAIDFTHIHSDPTVKQEWLNWVAYMVQQLDSPAVAFWQALNEPYGIANVSSIESLIIDTVNAIRTYSNKLVSCRFIAGWNPMSSTWSIDGITINNGSYYSPSLMDYLDFLSLTIYTDPNSEAFDMVSRVNWSMFQQTIANVKTAGKQVYVVEFGSNTSDDVAQRQYYIDTIENRFEPYGLTSCAGWAWQSRGISSIQYWNLNNGIANPRPAFTQMVSYNGVSQCLIDEDCPPGYHCDNNVCIEDLPVDTCLLSIVASTKATFNPPAGVYEYPVADATHVDITVNPNQGCRFVAWIVNGEISGDESTTIGLDMVQNYTVSAVLECDLSFPWWLLALGGAVGGGLWLATKK